MKKIMLQLTLLSVLISITPPMLSAEVASEEKTAYPGAPGGPQEMPNQPATLPELPQMSEAELAKWQEEIDTEIAKFVSTLPPEQQEQFHKDVAELTQVMETMSDDELVAFIDSLFPPEEVTPTPPVPVAPETKVVEEVKVEETKTLEIDKEATENTEKTLKLLTNLITRIERFLRKSQMIPDLPGKIDKWVSKDKVKEWHVDLTWSKLKAETEALDQKLHTIKESLDPKTKKYRYINDFVKNESLFSNLSKLSSTLTTYEPKIDVPDNNASLTKETRNAIKEVLGGLAEAIFTHDVNKELDKLIEKYEPRAKELRTEEETFEKTALEESKKPRKETPKKEAGTGTKGLQKTAGVTEYPGGGAYVPSAGGGYGYGGGTTYPGGGYGGTTYPGGYDGQVGGYGYGPAAGGTEAGRGAPGTKEAGKGGKEMPEGEEKNVEHKKPEKPAEKAVTKDPGVDRQVKTIEKQLSSAASSIENNPDFTRIEHHMTSADPADPALADDIRIAQMSMKKANDGLKAFDLALTKLEPEQKDYYSKDMKALVSEYAGLFTGVAGQIDNIKRRQGLIAADKQFAYLGVNPGGVAPALVAQIKYPGDLFALQKEFESFSAAVAKLK